MFLGVQPVSRIEGDITPGEKSSRDKYQLIFHGKALTENGKSLPRTVRVVANEDGKILKLSTSR